MEEIGAFLDQKMTWQKLAPETVWATQEIQRRVK
jgi:hypothetical protein